MQKMGHNHDQHSIAICVSLFVEVFVENWRETNTGKESDKNEVGRSSKRHKAGWAPVCMPFLGHRLGEGTVLFSYFQPFSNSCFTHWNCSRYLLAPLKGKKTQVWYTDFGFQILFLSWRYCPLEFICCQYYVLILLLVSTYPLHCTLIC